MSLKIAVGLGNVGAEYAFTRHNAGEIVLRNLAKSCGADFVYNKYCSAWLAKADIVSKSLTLVFLDGYMNNSGDNFARVLKYLKIDIAEVAVICDDINLAAGRVKLSRGGSAGGHNGIANIMERCGNGFVRVRVGIGAKMDRRMDLAEHVLGKLSETDLAAVNAFDAKDCFQIMLSRGFEAAQNVYNRRDK